MPFKLESTDIYSDFKMQIFYDGNIRLLSNSCSQKVPLNRLDGKLSLEVTYLSIDFEYSKIY